MRSNEQKLFELIKDLNGMLEDPSIHPEGRIGKILLTEYKELTKRGLSISFRDDKNKETVLIVDDFVESKKELAKTDVEPLYGKVYMKFLRNLFYQKVSIES